MWLGEPFSRGQAWVDLLLLANHEDNEVMTKGCFKKVKRGQLLTSTIKLAKRWEWSRNRVSRFLDVLADTNMVTKQTGHGAGNGTLLTIVNYDKFQNRWATDEATDEATNGATDGATDGATGGALTRSIRTKEDKKAPSSYWSERERQLREFEEWARQGDEDEQN